MNETLRKVKVIYNMGFVDIDGNLYYQQDSRYQTTVLQVEDTYTAAAFVYTADLHAAAEMQDANDAAIFGMADLSINVVSHLSFSVRILLLHCFDVCNSLYHISCLWTR